MSALSLAACLLISLNLNAKQAFAEDNSWNGQFYNSQNLTGKSTTVKYPELKFDWGLEAPEKGVSKDFSARFEKSIEGNKDYFVQSYADDGIRVKVGKQNIINRWSGSAGTYDKGLITGLGSGTHLVTTEYFDKTNHAVLFAEVVPLGDWYVFYYANKDLKGTPANAKVIKGGKNGSFSENYGKSKPMSGVPEDHFSAKYTTALRLDAGEYVIRTRVDDGVRVYVDGKLILDRWTTSNFREDAIYVNITDNKNANGSEKNIHWIEVQYFENTGESKIDFSINPLSEELSKNAWFGSYYNNKELTGNPVISIGGVNTNFPYTRLNFNFGYDQPNSKVNKDNFSARFIKLVEGGNEYFVQTYADDGIRVKVADKTIINRWSGSAGTYNKGIVTDLPKGIHLVQTEYFDKTNHAILFSEIVPFGDWHVYYYSNKDLSGHPVNFRVVKSNADGSLYENHGKSSPMNKVPENYFSARYTTAKRIDAGTYIIRTRADDGIRVYVDGNLVLDRWTTSAYQEDAVKIKITDNKNAKSGEENIHWIEVEYFENTGESAIEFSMIPYDEDSLISQDSWYAEYYNNVNFTGIPIVTGGKNFNNKISNLEFEWGYNSPHQSIKNDNFTARFIRDFKLPEGDYIIQSYADDGIRVYIDDQLVLDRWYEFNSKFDGKKITIRNRNNVSASQKDIHRVRVEFLEIKGKATVKFFLDSISNTASKDHWLGLFYPNMNLSGDALTLGGTIASSKISSIKYNWDKNSPMDGIPSEQFSASFYKKLEGGKDYFAVTYADDGVRVRVGDKTAIDRWSGSAGTYDKGLITGLSNGDQLAKVDYYDNINHAILFADILPLGEWYAYYYNNESLSGHPIQAQAIKPSKDGWISQDFGKGSPAQGVSNDSFSIKYVTAKKIKAGDYVLRAAADDGVRIYIDGELVFERWTKESYREDAKKITIKNHKDTGDIHWVEVQYFDNKNSGKINVSLEAYDKSTLVTDQGWYAEYFNNMDLSGTPVLVVGGKNSYNKVSNINYDWKQGSPHYFVNADKFSARFEKIMNLSSAEKYLISIQADDAVRFYLNGELVIDKWTSGNHDVNEVVQLKKGQNKLVVEYFENTGNAKLMVDIKKVTQLEVYRTVNYDYTFAYMVDMHMTYGTPKADGAGRTPASRAQVEYYANPSNFKKGSVEYYQFLDLSSPAGLDPDEVNRNVLKGKGILEGTAQDFIDAGEQYNINEAYLIAHALHETGNGTSDLAKGVWVDKNGYPTRDSKGKLAKTEQSVKKVYNMFGYSAYDSDPINGGAKFAHDNGWTSPRAAILGGAKYIANNYIHNGRNTLYKMRWNPDNPGRMVYATHVSWASSQTANIAKIYNMLYSYVKIFEVPQFKDQPAKSGDPNEPYKPSLVQYPDQVFGKVYNTGKSGLNLRKAATTSSEVIANIPDGTKIQVLGKNGDFYQVKYNGNTGYASSEYIDLLNLLEVTVSGLNIRENPSTSAKILGSVSKIYLAGVLDSKDKLTTSNEWYMVYYNGKQAWVSGGKDGTEYIKVW